MTNPEGQGVVCLCQGTFYQEQVPHISKSTHTSPLQEYSRGVINIWSSRLYSEEDKYVGGVMGLVCQCPPHNPLFLLPFPTESLSPAKEPEDQHIITG